MLINNSHNDIAEEAIHLGNNATVFQAEVLQWEEQHLTYFVEFIRRVGRDIRYLTTVLASSQPVSLSNCNCIRLPGAGPVSKQESQTNYI